MWVLTGRGSLGAGRCAGVHSCRSRKNSGELGSKLTVARRLMTSRGAQVPTEVIHTVQGVRRRRDWVSSVGVRIQDSEIR